MSPIEASTPQFNFVQPPPGFFGNPAPRGGSPPPSPTEQDPTLIHRLANVSRAKLDSLFHSRKDSGLLKHVLIQNLSRSYEELAPEPRTAEEMWFDACIEDLGDDDDDEAMYETAHFYYATNSSEEDLDLAMNSPPALSPDSPFMDESDLDLSYFDEDDSITPPIIMDVDDDRSAFFDRKKREQATILQRHLAPIPTDEALEMRYLQAQREREMEDWTSVSRCYY